MSSTSLYNKYPPHSHFGGKRVLNAGCGFSKYPAKNVVNLDAFKTCEPDVQWDLNKTPLPFKDNEFDLILANHLMEHLENWWECFSEFARILKPGGRLEIWVPGSGSDSELGYRDHVKIINHCSFYGVHGTTRGAGNAWAKEQDKKGKYVSRLKYTQTCRRPENNLWFRLLPSPLKLWATKHLRNVILEEGHIFEKMKEGEE